MPYRIKGTLKLPSGQPAVGVDIEFISRRNYSPLLMDLSSIIKTTPTGAYDITLEYGEYAVVVYWGCNQPSHIGKLFVFSDTVAGLDLQTLLQQADWQPATPEYIQQIQDWLAQAGASASQASESAASAKASEAAAEADRAEVASNKTIVIDAQSDVTAKAADVSTKAEQVATKAEQVAANTVTASEKADLAAAAADTASQKAVDAAASDASARDAAVRAENAALAMTGAILDGGQCDLSSGFYPQPLTVSGNKYSTVWYVKVGGTVGGITYDAGDKLQYTTANSGFYFRIDARDEVVSVQGEKGAVTLTPEKIGAEPAGTADHVVEQHATKAGAHNISGVYELAEALASKAPEGVDIFRDNGMYQNLNVAVRPGYYKYSDRAEGNPEAGNYGHLIVISPGMALGDGVWLQQIAFSHSGKCFTRRAVNNSEFTPWYKLYTSNNVPTRTDLGFGDSVTRNAGSSEGQLLYQGCDISADDWTGGKGFGVAKNFIGGSYCTWLRLQYRNENAPGKGLGGNIGVVYDGVNGGELAYSPFTWSEAGTIYFVRTTRNTTVDSNGFIKRASPIARLYGDEISAKRDSEYSISGCAAINHEATGVHATRKDIGVYQVAGSLGFATDGWYIETPADANGNKLLFVEYEQYDNGDIFIKTFSPDYSTGRCMAGEPKDIPEGRWIDLRLSMPSKK